MVELGQSADPRLLVPGDPIAVNEAQASMARLGQALLRVGDGLARVDTADWEGPAADAFHTVFDGGGIDLSFFTGVPAPWRGSGEAFADAADALSDHGGVLAWAQDEAAEAVREWGAAEVTSRDARTEHDRLAADEAARSAGEGRAPAPVPFVDPGEAGRVAARARLDRARAEVTASGVHAAGVVGRARDLAPPSPSLVTRVAGALGDVASGAGHEIAETGRFLWQIDPARLLVEPSEAVAGWKDLVSGVAGAATHPQQAAEGALSSREVATNPERFAGEVAAGVGLSALAGAGIAKRLRGAAEAGRIADALDDPDGRDQPPSSFRPGTWGGRTAAEHVVDGGAGIGRAGSGKRNKVPTREVDTSAEVDELYRTMSAGGQVVRRTDEVEVTALPDGTFLTYRLEAKSTPDGAALDIRDESGIKLKVHTPRGEPR